MMETEKVDGQPEAVETPVEADVGDAGDLAEAGERIIQLPLSTICELASRGVGEPLANLYCDWAVVYWWEDEDSRELRVEGFSDRDDAAEWLASMYQRQDDIEAILYQGRPKKFEIEVKAKISLR